MQELWKLDARELAAGIASRDFSSAEVVDAHIARIEAVNPALNAIVAQDDAAARAAAADADKRVAAGEKLGALHGVPFTVKENIDVAGFPTTWGVPAFAEAVPPVDAPIVERMKAAGAIMIGRTNLPDMALRVHTDSSLRGLTRNPWNAARTTGGSSGGEAAALASGMSPIGLGNDIGGSLRNPASPCGICSIRPSQGRVPDAGYVPSEDRLLVVQLMNSQGPMARRVADVRLGLQTIMGRHARDGWSITAPLDGPPIDGRIKVALIAEPPGGPTDPKVAAATRAAADRLANQGYDVVEAVPERYVEAFELGGQFILGDFASILDQLGPLMGESGRAFLDGFSAATGVFPDTSAMSAFFSLRDGVARAWAEFLDAHPLILTPTWTQLPFENGFDAATPENALYVREMLRCVMPANLMGLPSACVPAAHDAETNLPIGVILTGQRFRDDLCLDAAEHLEAAFHLPTPIDPAR